MNRNTLFGFMSKIVEAREFAPAAAQIIQTAQSSSFFQRKPSTSGTKTLVSLHLTVISETLIL